MNKKIYLFTLLTLTILFFSTSSSNAYPDDAWYHNSEIVMPPSTPVIIFPVQGGAVFTDDFNHARSGGRVHEANDLMAPKMTPILAARGGTIVTAPIIEPSYGYIISIAGDDGFKYNYLHINNDTPGTDDGNGGLAYAYAPGISRGVTVTQGQVIAYVGDSGNAEDTAPHLHFEIISPDGTAINPYPYLVAALNISDYNIAAIQAASPNINFDRGLTVQAGVEVYCSPGALIRTPSVSSIYYCGADGKRYVFPNAQTYATWYSDFSGVTTISLEEMGMIMLGGNVTYRPGVKLVKIQTDPRVYAVNKNGTLRLMITPAIADKYYGANWNKQVEDIPDAFFTNYKIGASINN
ncbi:MAG: M23 family metallopeptidase [bacterium]|nr:M23 family metallopeptidase [bacterium]